MRRPTRKVVVFGTGGNCIDIVEALQAVTSAKRERYECVGFLDDKPELWGNDVRGIPVLGPLSMAASLADVWFVNGIGSPRNFWNKESIVATANVPLSRFLTVVHPTASVSPSAVLGAGTVVFDHVTICNSVRIGSHVMVLPNSVISHDSVVMDFSCIAGGVCVSGNVRIGKSAYLGAGSLIRDGARIGDYSLVGMGAVVVRDCQPRSVVVGNPARPLQRSVATG